jgi:pyrroline-5-carboxylate reductase
MARGWIAAGLAPSQLVLVDPKPGEATLAFVREHDLRLVESPVGILVHVLVLAVKPQIIREVLAEVAPAIGPHTMVLSIAAGVQIATIAGALSTSRIVRAMPNTPAQVGKGITGVVGSGITDGDRAVAESLLGAMGQAIWFKSEGSLDAVTAVSGSGPAYVFYLVESLAAAAMRHGLEAGEAMQLARQTVIGAAALMEADPLPAAQLRENVTSPNGTTAAALSVLMAPDGLAQLMERAVFAAKRRSEELGRG